MAITRSRVRPPEAVTASGYGTAGNFGWGSWWRSKPAQRNIDTAQWRPDDSIQLVPVTAAVLLLARTLSLSDMIVERLGSDGRWRRTTAHKDIPAWADPQRRPNEFQSHDEFLKNISLNLTVFGNAVVRPVERKHLGEWPSQVASYPWWTVSVYPAGSNEPVTFERRMNDMDAARKLGVPGQGGAYTEIRYHVDGAPNLGPLTSLTPKGDVLHIRYATLHDVIFGQSPLSWAAPAIRSAVAADAYAELGIVYGFGPPGILAHRGKPGTGAVEAMTSYLEEVMRNPQRRHSPTIASGEWNYIRTFIPPAELQLMESRKYAFSLAAAAYGVPRELLGSPDVQIGGTGIRHLQRYFAVFSGHDHLRSVGAALSEMLPPDFRVRFIPNHLLELEPSEQSRVHDRYIRAGVMMPSEVRAELGLPDEVKMTEMDEKVCEKLWGSVGEGGGASDSGKDFGEEDTRTTNMDE